MKEAVMLNRYKLTFVRLANTLHKLKRDPTDLEVLWDLQMFLIQKLRRCERGITRTRQRMGEIKSRLRSDRPARQEAARMKRRVKHCEHQIDEYRRTIYFIKCFGDGIAFLYLDTFALKHTFYKTTDYSVREEPGFLIANSGFGNECRIARRFLREGIPVLLCDLTNVVRYGDICLLVDSDPHLVEVKSSSNQNSRTIRQQQNLTELREFYLNDGAAEFRGKGKVVRQALNAEPVTHAAYMNDLISRALVNEVAWGSPEHGLMYVATVVSPSAVEQTKEAIGTFCQRQCVAFPLNEAKNTADWLPLYPFTLSLSANHVVPFLLGEIFLLVLVDLGALKWNFAKLGAAAVVIEDNNYAIQVMCKAKDPSAGVFRVSRQMFSRIALEFWSLEWFAKEQSTISETIDAALTIDGNVREQLPTEWLELDDGIQIHSA
jgi:hypothetical protein